MDLKGSRISDGCRGSGTGVDFGRLYVVQEGNEVRLQEKTKGEGKFLEYYCNPVTLFNLMRGTKF